VTSAPSCSTCRFTPTDRPTSDRPHLVKVLRGDRPPSWVCTFCLLTVLSRIEWDGQATVFLSEQFAEVA
jgi:hypothetical protein